MQIHSTYIPAQPTVDTTQQRSNATALARGKQTLIQATDSYRKNSERIIDAEYVELYSPARYRGERQALDNTLESEQASPTHQAGTSANQSVAFNRYQQKPQNTPLPGTHLNIFA